MIHKLEDLEIEDIKRIKTSWFHSYKEEWECKFMSMEIYKKFFDKIINSVMVQDDNRFFLYRDATHKLIYWACLSLDKKVLHYAYCIKGCRDNQQTLNEMNLKIREILGFGKIECTFLSYFMLKLFNKKVELNPFKRFI